MRNTLHNRPHTRQSGGLILNLGIGILLGLLAALLAVFLVMRGGPFKDKDHGATTAPTPVTTANNLSTDPNAPLYGAPVQTLDPKTNAAAPADATAAILGAGATSAASVAATPHKAVPKKPAATQDPVAAIVNAASKPATTPPPKIATPQASDNENTPPAKPKPAPQAIHTPAKESKPSTLPKEVKPTTLPKNNDGGY